MTSVNRYPPPDWNYFAKSSAGLVGFLVLLHWVPQIATWIHSAVWGKRLIVDLATFRRVLYVAYVISGVAVSCICQACFGRPGITESASNERLHAAPQHFAPAHGFAAR